MFKKPSKVPLARRSRWVRYNGIFNMEPKFVKGIKGKGILYISNIIDIYTNNVFLYNTHVLISKILYSENIVMYEEETFNEEKYLLCPDVACIQNSPKKIFNKGKGRVILYD